MSTAIDISGLSHAFGEVPVLEDLTFQIKQGEFFVIIGPNGSGKTTLLKLFAGILTAKAGRIDVLKRPIGNYKRKSLARTIAFVPQNASVDFPFTVAEVVRMGRAPHLGLLGLEAENDLAIAARAMDFTEVKHLADRRLNQLSGGECQRVFIARAICQETDIILLDEPTAALDLAHQAKIMDLMETLQRQKNITVVMVSHDVNLAAMYGNQLLLLKEGRIVRYGNTADVLTIKTLQEAYGCPLLVDESPLGDFPRVTPLPGRLISKT